MKATGMLLAVTAAMGLAACGGTWTDDPGNWRRAFGQPKPDDVEVVHSLHWESSGVARQFRYFFQLKPNASLSGRLVANENLREILVKPGPVVTNICGKKPDWFLPRPPEHYRTWVSPNLMAGNLMLYEDRDTRDIFIANFKMLPESKAQFK